MTDTSEATAARGRRTIITILVVTALLLLPLLGGLWYAADNALQHKSTTDWRANHQAKRSLVNAALLIAGVPAISAGLTWILGTVLGRRPGVAAATGALLGTLGLWAAGLVAFCVAFGNTTF
ncbi:hypothetical protein ACWF94_08900 [Streptomyces sp. NPDC055078]